MDWKEWNGKHIFVRLNNGSIYSGNVIDVDDSSKPLIFFKIIDKFGNNVTFVQTEILSIKEEEKR